ncbi:P-loop NTPase family protein [Mariniblastus fucicola]|uniref:Topology modulation protein n=1 Tax=Mariniblastus fucicola TaxID=980251 RepID=A0A5B9P515_9BACT|nr:shikimate kinase [Mariniblastus fucicola]QEG21498.1 topology modulation protein [Mariniblastus fucicola]
MRKVIVFGNSGSGKSTLAKSLAASNGLAHFDLDTIAWLPTSPPERMPIAESGSHIGNFISANASWVIEGCYADLLEIASHDATEAVFLNLSVDDCVSNAQNRPWEPHKYPSKQAQDENLEMLLNWIRSYPTRDDPCSQAAHEKLYSNFQGTKTMVAENR